MNIDAVSGYAISTNMFSKVAEDAGLQLPSIHNELTKDNALLLFKNYLIEFLELNRENVKIEEKKPKKYGKFQQFKNFSWCKYDIDLNNCLNVFYDIVNYLPGKDVQQYFDLNILNFDENQKKEIMKEIMFISEGRLWHKKWKGKNNPERNVFGKAFYLMPLEGRRRYYWPPTNELVTLMKISKYSGVEYTLLKYRVEKRGQHHLLSLEIPSKEEKNEI